MSMRKRYRRTRVRSVVSVLESLQVCSDARGVLAEVTFPKARDRAHVDATAAVGGRDANDDVVLEPKPGRRIGRFDAPLIRRRGDNLPADVARGIQCPLESRIRRFGNSDRVNIRIRLALLLRNTLSLVLHGVSGTCSERDYRDESRWILGIGCDVV